MASIVRVPVDEIGHCLHGSLGEPLDRYCDGWNCRRVLLSPRIVKKCRERYIAIIMKRREEREESPVTRRRDEKQNEKRR